MPKWDLVHGLYVIRAIQPQIRKYGFHVALAGGVLNKGESDKDLDLVFLPMGGFDRSKDVCDGDALLIYLSELWGQAQPLGADPDYNDVAENSLYLHAVKFQTVFGQRIDCFIIR
jgi:hypothetical protein